MFTALKPHNFRVDATILEKRKAQRHLYSSDERFYQYAWFYHMRYVAPRIAAPGDEMLVIAASIGIRRKRDAFHRSVANVMQQVTRNVMARTTHWPAEADTGLQIADYCAWAIQRKWEGNDPRSFSYIESKVMSEFEIFKFGRNYYY